MPAKLLPDSKVHRLLRQGLTPRQIADRLLAEDYIDVTPEAISMWRHRRGMTPMVTRHPELIPWILKPQHQDLWPAQMLRLEGRRRAGEELSQRNAGSLQRWKARLEKLGAVVHYDPDTDQGFFNVARRVGVDHDLIRDPNK